MGWSDDEDECNAVTLYSLSTYVFRVRWEGNWRGSTRDLDVYLKQGSTVSDMSEEAQSGGSNHNPYEQFTYTHLFGSGDYCLVIEQKAGDDPEWVQVLIEGAGSPVNHMEHRTEGYAVTSPGETANTGALTVGATAYNNTNTIQSYSSRGPTPDGRIKPDIVGVDAVRSDVYSAAATGTSFAAPHVTGLAALVKQRNPGFTPAEIATYLKTNALPRGEPHPNNTWGYGLAFLPHIGPVIEGDPRSGIELTANTNDVDDIDGIPASPTYTYQWIRVSSGGTEANIAGATSSTYTPVQADVGSTLKVKVSFQDSATTPNDEEQESVASLRVVPAASANRAATGVPTVSGTLRVTETLTASTSAIRDADGLSGVTYKYQWVRVDAGTDTDISGAEGQTYVLQEADQGKTVKVRVTFEDYNRNAEERESAETGSIGVKANIPPAFPSGEDGMREVEETRGGEAHVAQDIGAPVAATDPDGDTLTYSIKDGSDLFEIDSSGQLRTKAAVDYEIPRSHRHTIVVQVTDSKDIDGVADTVIDDTINVTITVTNVDDPPVITGPQTVDWPENAAGTITTYRASDPEGVATFLSLIDTGDDESFTFSSGRLSFKSTALPDFEGKQQYHIELGATTDFLALAFDTTYAVTINITDVDEPPEITLAAGGSGVTVDGNAVSVDENYDDPLAYVTATDPESTHTDYTLALGGTHSSSFTLSSAGELRFTNPPDHEAREVYRLRLTASNASESSTLNVTVTVGDVNEAPVVTRRSGRGAFSIEENSGTTVGSFDADDPENDDVTWSLAPGGDSRFFEIDETSGALSFKESEFNENEIPDYESSDLGSGLVRAYNVTVRATEADDGDPQTSELPGSLAVTVEITDVNEAPVVMRRSGTGAFSIEENSGTTVGSFDADDPEGRDVTWSLAPGGDSRFFEIDETSGALSFKESEFNENEIPDYESTGLGNDKAYSVTVRATEADDGDPQTRELTGRLAVTVRITNVNEAPVVTGMAEVTVNEGHTGLLRTYQKSDPDRPMQTTNWGPVGSSEVLSGADSDAFAFDQDDGQADLREPAGLRGWRLPVPGHPDRQRRHAGGQSRHHRERRQPGGDGRAHLRGGRTAGRQRRAATGDADGSGRRRHADVGVAAQDGHVGRLDGHREHRRQQLYADRRRCRPLPARERHVHGRGRYDRDHLDHGHRVPDGERCHGEPAPDAARPASPGRRHPGERRRGECRASGVHRPGGRAADLLDGVG